MSDRARASGVAGLSRRDFIQRAVAAGVMASPAAALLSACGLGTSGGAGSGSGSASSENPFGVNASTPLNIVIFKGGYGDDYAKYDIDLYKKRYSGAQLTETGMQQLAQHLQPQFVAGTPPDVLDDSGAGNIAPGSLVSQGQLAELGDLFDAPSIDDPKSKVKDTLIAGTQEAGAFSGKQYGMIYTLSLYSIWYSQSLFKEKGWSYPRTWPEMLTLCAEIQKTGMAPWIYQGKYPVYMIQIWQEMAQKLGGAGGAQEDRQPGAQRLEAA
jgi:N-acetylglucosamine transport system substrate-binding protein